MDKAKQQPQEDASITAYEAQRERAYDEAKGLDHPRIWTAERDLEMWTALETAD